MKRNVWKAAYLKLETPAGASGSGDGQPRFRQADVCHVGIAETNTHVEITEAHQVRVEHNSN